MLFRGVTVDYDGVRGLGPIDLDGPVDKPWLFVGPSGSGKTTILKVIAGLVRPSSGILEGFPSSQETGFLPQFPDRVLAGRNLAEDVTGKLGLVSQERKALRAKLKEHGLEHVSLTRVSATLSAGEKRTLSYLILAQSGFAHWALDEPDAGLDSQNRSRLVSWISSHSRSRSGNRIWIASHRVRPFQSLDPWVVVLNQGQVAWTGSIKKLSTSEAQPGFMSQPLERVRTRIWPNHPGLDGFVSETLRNPVVSLAQIKALLEDSEFVN